MIRALERLDDQPDSGERTVLNPVNAVETRLSVLYATHPGIERRIDVLRDDFTPTEPAPTDPGPILGTTTQFGLTVAPGLIVAGYAVLCARATGLLGRGAPFSGSLLTTAVVTTAVLLWGLSLLAFLWAMLFGAGGTPTYGLVSVCAMAAAVLIGLGGDARLGVLASSPLAGVAVLHALTVARSALRVET
jgi:hypothetical protein